MMNYQYGHQSGLLEEIKKFFSKGSALSIVILINIAIWLIIQLVHVLLFFFNTPDNSILDSFILHLFAIPASVDLLAVKPWTAFTYMFLHLEFWHLIFNMLWLFWFGKIFSEFLSDSHFIAIYIVGGLAGGLTFILAFNFFPVFASMVPVSFALGASASVMAIVTAISFYVPDYQIQLLFIGRIKIMYLAIILFVFDFFMIPTGNAGGHLAHIGGALFGFSYIQIVRTMRKGNLSNKTTSIFDMFRMRSPKKSQDSGSRPDYSGRPVSDEEYNLKKRDQQKRIDEILEKISKGGYDSLTKEEKDFLFRTSTRR